MCNKEETKQAIREVLHEPNGEGETMIAQEINEHFDLKANQIVTRLTVRFGISLVAVTIGATGMWFGLENKVANNTENITEGGRFTQEEHDVYVHNHNSVHSHLGEDIEDIKKDTEAIRKAVTGI